MAKQRNDGFSELEERYAGYEVYDRDGDKIGRVDDLFVDENDNPEYIGVKMGFLGRKSTLIPWDKARVDEGERRIEVLVDKATAKEGPAFDDDEEITPEYEERVHNHYGLGSTRGAETRGAYGAYYSGSPYGAYSGGSSVGEERPGEERPGEERPGEERPGVAGTGGADRGREEYYRERSDSPGYEGAARRGDLEDEPRARSAGEERPGAGMGGADRGDFAEEERRDRERERLGEERPGVGGADRGRGEYRERPASPGYGGVAGRGGDLENEDEIRVQRTEEELRVETREREVGGTNVRKRVRTDREQVRVPTRREEVHVERVPVEGREAPGAEIGEDEIFVPVTEEEVVIEKQPVVKEEILIRKDVTRDEEIVEEDVRKEEIDIDDQTGLRGGRDTGLGDETRRRDR